MLWRHRYLGLRGDGLMIDRYKVWDHEWRWLNAETVRLPNPCEPAKTLFYAICEVGPRRKPVRFAAAQVQDELWSFYVPD